MATTNDLKNGLVMVIDGQLWQVVEFQHVKPGKGPAFVRTKIKNVLSGKTVDRTFNAGVKIETATVDRRDMTYLYQDGDDYVFMDGTTFEQLTVPGEVVGNARNFMVENQDVIVSQHDGTVRRGDADRHRRARQIGRRAGRRQGQRPKKKRPGLRGAWESCLASPSWWSPGRAVQKRPKADFAPSACSSCRPRAPTGRS